MQNTCVQDCLMHFSAYQGNLKEYSESELEAILEKLKSHSFSKKLNHDVYWPKWNSPWWFILFLYEIGEISRVDKNQLIQILIHANKQFLHIFPLLDEDVDREINGCTEVLCFCFLGCLIKVCISAGLNAFEYIPWANDWFEQYQLPDGGYNCDEAAYNGSKKSSLLSTAPMIEAMIAIKQSKPNFTKFDANIKRGMQYLLDHQIFLTSSGQTMKGCGWEKIKFPIFYEYDYLRGLEIVIDCAQLMKQPISRLKINEALLLCKDIIARSAFYSEIDWLNSEKTVEFKQNKIIMFENLASVPEFINIFNSNIPNKYVFNRIRNVFEKISEAEKYNLIK